MMHLLLMMVGAWIQGMNGKFLCRKSAGLSEDQSRDALGFNRPRLKDSSLGCVFVVRTETDEMVLVV
jgi:hypothetical protein